MSHLAETIEGLTALGNTVTFQLASPDGRDVVATLVHERAPQTPQRVPLPKDRDVWVPVLYGAWRHLHAHLPQGGIT